jgi:peptidoglycan/LPS O-acetylase OafA/YrhL
VSARSDAVAREIPSLTPLRGVAALFVVAFHLRFYVPNLGYEEVAPLFLFGYLWVDFFFVLSGFIILHVYGADLARGFSEFPYARFLYLRWCRIYPLHAAILALFVACELLFWALHSGAGLVPEFAPFSETHTLSGVASHLLLVSSLNVHDTLMWNYAAWSISAEWVAYLAFPLLAVALSGRSRAVGWLAFSLLLAGLDLLARSNGGRLALHHHWGAVRCLLEFSIGLLVYQAYRASDHRLVKSDAAFLAALAWILYAMNHYVRDVLIVPGFALLVLCAARNQGFVARALASRPLRHLGEISYSIYMVNILIFQIALFAWSAIAGSPFGQGFTRSEAWSAWFTAMGVVVLVAHVTHRWIEQPTRAWLRRRDPFRRALQAQQAPEVLA